MLPRVIITVPDAVGAKHRCEMMEEANRWLREGGVLVLDAGMEALVLETEPEPDTEPPQEPTRKSKPLTPAQVEDLLWPKRSYPRPE